MAALGTTVGFFLGYELESTACYLFSLGFAVFGSVLFAFLRLLRWKIPQEGLIGMVYVVSAAFGILLLGKSHEGAEHLKYLLVGHLLTVSPRDIFYMIFLYGGIGVLHFIFHKRFWQVSHDSIEANRLGTNFLLWDFLFYLTFSLVVTTSVATAGVFLVFSYLVIPVLTAVLLSNTFPGQLLWGWGIGAGMSFVGMTLSYFIDTPLGPVIICALGAAFTAVAVVKTLFRR